MTDFPKGTIEHMDSMLDSGRQIYGVPGAGLTWGIKGNKGIDVNIGMEGEKMVGGIINEWVSQHPNTLSFHSTRCPNLGDADTDHVVIIGATVVLVDSKRWMSKRKYSVSSKGDILRGTVAFPEGKQVTIKPQMKKWREAVPEGVSVAGVVCIAQSEVFVPYDDNWRRAPFRLVTADKLVDTLDYYNKRARKDLQIDDTDDLPLWEGEHALLFASRLIKPRETEFEKKMSGLGAEFFS